jgi:uncharacterized membrane protein YfcA
MNPISTDGFRNFLEALIQVSGEPVFQEILLAGVGIWAGIQNALAGGGSFITLPALMATGLSPLDANITSTVALFPGQVVSGGMGIRHLGPNRPQRLWSLILVSLFGGAIGGFLLVGTPARIFALLLPWLVLFATGVFAWGSFRRKSTSSIVDANPFHLLGIQGLIAIYGGYFGGGIGFLMLAALTLSGLPTRTAGHLKNAFAAVMNLSAVAVFATSPALHWHAALVLGGGAILGFASGSHLLRFINEKLLRGFVIVLGLTLGTALFLRAP